MPLPCPQVLIEYLNLHEAAREPERNSFLGTVAAFADQARATLTHDTPVIQQLKQIKEQAISEIEKADTVEKCIKLVYLLEELAEKAQKLKFKSDPSLLSTSLHGAINYILHTMASENDEINMRFQQEIHRLIESTQSNQAKATFEIKTISTKDLEKLEKDYKSELRKLAILGDEKAFTKAKFMGLFSYLDAYPTAWPNWLKNGFYKSHYESSFQSSTKIAFSDFERRAIHTFTDKQLEDEMKKTQQQEEDKKVRLETDLARQQSAQKAAAMKKRILANAAEEQQRILEMKKKLEAENTVDQSPAPNSEIDLNDDDHVNTAYDTASPLAENGSEQQDAVAAVPPEPASPAQQAQEDIQPPSSPLATQSMFTQPPTSGGKRKRGGGNRQQPALPSSTDEAPRPPASPTM